MRGALTCLEVGTGPSVAEEYVRGARLVRGTSTGFVLCVEHWQILCARSADSVLGALSTYWSWLCARGTGLCEAWACYVCSEQWLCAWGADMERRLDPSLLEQVLQELVRRRVHRPGCGSLLCAVHVGWGGLLVRR